MGYTGWSIEILVNIDLNKVRNLKGNIMNIMILQSIIVKVSNTKTESNHTLYANPHQSVNKSKSITVNQIICKSNTIVND